MVEMGSLRPKKVKKTNYGHLRPIKGSLRQTWTPSYGLKTFRTDRGLFKRKRSPLIGQRALQTNGGPSEAADPLKLVEVKVGFGAQGNANLYPQHPCIGKSLVTNFCKDI